MIDVLTITIFCYVAYNVSLQTGWMLQLLLPQGEGRDEGREARLNPCNITLTLTFSQRERRYNALL
jgi:hypothetical protein